MRVAGDDFSLFQDEDLGGFVADAGPFGDFAGEGALFLNDDGVDGDFGVAGGEAFDFGLGGPADGAGGAVFEQDGDFLLFDCFEIEGGGRGLGGFGQPVEHLP